MLSVINARIYRLGVYLLVLVLPMSGSAGGAAERKVGEAVDCADTEKDWSCFGALETEFYAFTEKGRALIERASIQRFRNDEIRGARETFELGKGAARAKVSTYFLALPSRVELLQGWEKWEHPKEFVKNEHVRYIDILKATFPDGPGSISRKLQYARGTIKRQVHPLRWEDRRIAVTAWKSDDGVIKFQYSDFGEPIGVYEINGTWMDPKRDPLPDDYSVADMQSSDGWQFGSLGEARNFTPKP